MSAPSRNENRNAAIVGGLLVIAFVAFVAIFGIEKVSDEHLVGASGPARFNEFLAAERLLSRMGVPATSVNNIDVPERTDTALIVLTTSRVLSQSRIDALHRWVASGGHLVVAAPVSGGSLRRMLEEFAKKASENSDKSKDKDDSGKTDEEEEEEQPEDDLIEDPLLADYGVSVMRTEAWLNAMGASYTPKPDTGAGAAATGPAVVTVLDEPWSFADGPLGDIDLDDPAVLQMDPWPQGLADAGPHYTLKLPDGSELREITPMLLQFPVGQGWLTVLPGPDPWDNYDIGKADHATVLWTLLTRPGTPAAATIVYAHDAPSLWSLLWGAVWPAVIASGVLLITWLWAASRRFGPILVPAPPAVRSLGEHIEATGRYLWRTNHRLAMLQSAQRAARKRLLRGAALGEDGPEALTALAVEMAGLDPVDARAALTANDVEHPVQFTRHMRALVRILGAARRRSS